ncbi:unnamed protein product [Arctia plantaginis]|uniref:Chitin-binding type-2 domain-containing protein n=1 Tax=Arctia plantaginis TaxID=874455 RepID=A0A8S0ZVH0_ARCPL|nr:unnamed protein product [Arctia plantaginis]CAB3235949.1 unnamed protein product [Arctia plantaginis]
MENKFIFVVFILCGVVWQAHAAVNCTAAGRFADPSDTTCKNYTLCVLSNGAFLAYNYVCPTTSLFNPTSRQCTAATNYVCPVANTTNTTTNVCTAEGYFADPAVTDCSSYIQCVLINGVYTQTTFTCPANTFYDPNTTLCDASYNCTSTTAFTCTASGRFANTADTTCQTYFYCVLLATGTYTQYNYTCPTTSVFSPTSSLCTTSYTCTG